MWDLNMTQIVWNKGLRLYWVWQGWS